MGEHKVIFSPRSRTDLQGIVRFVRRGSGSGEVAERFGLALVSKAMTLASFPERGRVVPELGQPEVREIIFRSHRIVYRVLPGVVQIIRFWHGARGTPEINIDEF